MNKMIVFMLLCTMTTLCIAQDNNVIKLQCKGLYRNQSADLHDVPISGIYLEIKDKQVKISGAPGFDATYAVILNNESGLGFKLESNPSYSGYLNRLDGNLFLIEKGETEKDGSFTLKQGVDATCEKAKPIF